MRIVFALTALALLVGCGADGAPVAPQPKPAAGLSISGETSIGFAQNGTK
jgi:hypothetical protein